MAAPTAHTSCIVRPPRTMYLKLYDIDVELCEGDVCAAALLSYFESWHNARLSTQEKARQANDTAEQHGAGRAQDESLWQWHTEAELEAGVMVAKRSTIATALKKLVDWGFLTIGRNPNQRYQFDRTRFFLFHPEAVNTRIEQLSVHELKIGDREVKNNVPSPKNKGRSTENNAPSPKNKGTIPYSTSYPTEDPTEEKTPFVLLRKTSSPPAILPVDTRGSRPEIKSSLDTGKPEAQTLTSLKQRIPRKTSFPSTREAQDTLKQSILDPAFSAWFADQGLARILVCPALDQQWAAFALDAQANGRVYASWRQAFMKWLTSKYQERKKTPAYSVDDLDAWAAQAKERCDDSL